MLTQRSGSLLVAFLGLAAACTNTAGLPRAVVQTHASDATRTLVALDVLAVKLKGRRLRPAEVAQATRDLRSTAPAIVYERHVDQWLDPAALERVGSAMVATDGTVTSLFVDALAVHRTPDGHEVYYLRHQSPNAGSSEGPCRPQDVVAVHPWWALGTSLQICSSSYLPDHVFDSVGYCGGQADPAVPIAPRPGCGCGPFLVGCLPPKDSHPDLVKRMDRDVIAEIAHTAALLIDQGASYADLIKTSRTWQTGLIRFLYARREIIGKLATRRFDAPLEKEIGEQLAKIDLDQPGAMIERGGLYAGSGLFVTTISPSLAEPGYRSMSYRLLTRELCHASFQSVTVHADALLLITATTPNLRLKDVHKSPMRHQEGCRDCHSPIDETSAFMLPLTTALYGSMPTGRTEQATLVVKGHGDDRAVGVGFADLMRIVSEQPEFAPCSVDRFFAYFVDRPPSELESASFQSEQKLHNARLKDLFRAILLGHSFTRGLVR